MGELMTIVVTEAAKNIPAIVLAAVAAASILMNANTIKARWKEQQQKITDIAAAVSGVPEALEKVKQHDRQIMEIRQEMRDASLLASQYVNRAELVASLSTTGEKVHARIDKVENELTRLDERSKHK